MGKKRDYHSQPEQVSKQAPHLSRRAFVALGASAALASLWGIRYSWANVGSGKWGDWGAVATPGSHFGYDAGWGYSYDKTVWISASANCTVGRMTELFVGVQVEAHIACGGIWNPTWFPDIPDVPTYAYIRRDDGQWMNSAYWIVDMTYDHNYYVHMTGTTLVVERFLQDWRCWCGAEVRGLGGNAPGSHSVAEAPQIIPRHTLVDDASWHGKIVTMQPLSAQHLFLDVAAGNCANQANVEGWEATYTTNQNWLVIESSRGRTSLVPVHVGATPLYLDSFGSTWNDGANVCLCTWGADAGQSLYLHRLEDGSYLPIFECSGCALNIGPGSRNGANIYQWNSYNDRRRTTYNWRLEEVRFRTRNGVSVNLRGTAEPGEVLEPEDPQPRCVPFNYPGTSGLYYRYAWYRGEWAGACSVLVQSVRETSKYSPTEADRGYYLTCVITAFARYRNTPYTGKVLTTSLLVPAAIAPSATVSFYADGESSPCYTDSAELGASYSVPSKAKAAAIKSNCGSLDGWYRDKACTVRFRDGSVVQGELALYARNRVVLSYGLASESYVVTTSHSFYLDRQCFRPLVNPRSLLPSSKNCYYGDRVVFEQGPSVWFEDMSRVREVSCEPGAFSNAAASSPIMTSARVTRNTTVYLSWRIRAYDGIALS